MAIIYLVRHGETLHNITQRVQGWCDSPLTEKGWVQAQQAGKRLKDIRFDLAFCGDLKRHKDTASQILKENSQAVPILQIDSRFREIGFGSYEEKREAEMLQSICSAAGENYQTFLDLAKNKTKVQIADLLYNMDPTAESGTQAVSRFLEGLQEVVSQADSTGDDSTVLIVSSGAIMGAVLEEITAKNTLVPYINNGAILILTVTDDQILLYNF